MWATRHSERGERSCTRSIDFYAWPKTRFQPRMSGTRKCPVLQMWTTGLVGGVRVRASGRWYSIRGKNGSKGHACGEWFEKSMSLAVLVADPSKA
jgi:hypothetical protein